ncbi:YlaH-like family protein [Fredinandcohnia quinoae]|uniref:YlaH-like family protein n=1 Tax=Fredinandcohnia quinoae TaxID=2918902 RepID=A0AAW5E1P9_9BACI|nr:YlaH-like family protein [Fredinandcohnia sp. SECRCQ15]MCH1623931.1 YlaH-like family protein [Fredinandcohnia sp. SECRCQ15]
MWPIAKAVYTYSDPSMGANILYVVILLLSIIVFKLGFAKKLPLLKTIVIYIFLALGCTFLTFFGAFLPVAEGLTIAALILIIYKIRLRRVKKEEAKFN